MKAFSTIFLAVFVPVYTLAQDPILSDTLRKNTDSAVQTVPAGITQQPSQPVKAGSSEKEKPVRKTARKDTRPLIKRFDIDINTGFWTNSRQATGELMATVSYRFPKILSIGAGPTYVYSYNWTVNQSLQGWGGKIFVRAQLVKFFFLWTEYQGLSNQYVANTDPVEIGKGYSDSWFWGAGINFFGVNFSVIYDILHDSRSAYASATILRLGYSF